MNQLTLTVNSGTGTDTPSGSRPAALTNGDYSAYPFATPQAALDACDKHSAVTITIASGVHTGFLVQGFAAPVEVVGTNANVTPTTGVASGTAGTGTTNTAIKKPSAAANWTADELRGAMVVVTGGGGYYADSYIPFFGPPARRIVGNTTDTLTIDTWGFGTLDNTTTFAIVRPATLVNAVASNWQNVSFCFGAVDNGSRVSLRNLKPNTVSPMYALMAQNNNRMEAHGIDLPQRANGTAHWSVIQNESVLLTNFEALGDGTEIGHTSYNLSVTTTSMVCGDVQLYVRENNYAKLQVDGKANSHRLVRPSYCGHVVLDVRINSATATCVDLVANGYVETTRLTGTNGSIAASGPAVTVDGGGKCDFTGADISGPTSATLRIGTDSFLTWAEATASSYMKGSQEIVASSGQNPLVPARVMSKLMAGNTDYGVTATGSDQSGAYAITKPYTYVTGGNQGIPNGVRLPSAATADVPYFVINAISAPIAAGSSGLAVFPASGDTILPLSANTRDFVYPGMMAIYIPISSTQWRAINIPTKSDATSMTISGPQWFYNGVRFLSTLGCESFNPASAAVFDIVGGLTQGLRFRDGSSSDMMTFDTSNDVIRADYAFQERRRVTSHTADATLTVADGGRTLNNKGATGAVTFTLPTATAGLVFRFRVMAAQSLRFKCASGDTIQWDGTSVTASEDLRAATVGHCIEVECQDADTWFVTSSRGTWTKV